MAVIARCECCEKPIPEDHYRSWTGDGDLCATCTVGLLVRERDVALEAKEGVVAIIRELVRVNDSPDGAVGDVRAALGDEAAGQLRAILGGQ